MRSLDSILLPNPEPKGDIELLELVRRHADQWERQIGHLQLGYDDATGEFDPDKIHHESYAHEGGEIYAEIFRINNLLYKECGLEEIDVRGDY